MALLQLTPTPGVPPFVWTWRVPCSNRKSLTGVKDIDSSFHKRLMNPPNDFLTLPIVLSTFLIHSLSRRTTSEKSEIIITSFFFTDISTIRNSLVRTSGVITGRDARCRSMAREQRDWIGNRGSTKSNPNRTTIHPAQQRHGFLGSFPGILKHAE